MINYECENFTDSWQLLQCKQWQDGENFKSQALDLGYALVVFLCIYLIFWALWKMFFSKIYSIILYLWPKN